MKKSSLHSKMTLNTGNCSELQFHENSAGLLDALSEGNILSQGICLSELYAQSIHSKAMSRYRYCCIREGEGGYNPELNSTVELELEPRTRTKILNYSKE